MPVKLERTRAGGHLGHLFHMKLEEDINSQEVASFGPMELARFLDHVATSSK